VGAGQGIDPLEVSNTLSDQEIIDLIREALLDMHPERAHDFEGITLDTTVQELYIDSISAVEMVGYIEDSIGRSFQIHDVAGVRKLADIAALIRAVR
jgi:acyl carrier protein